MAFWRFFSALRPVCVCVYILTGECCSSGNREISTKHLIQHCLPYYKDTRVSFFRKYFHLFIWLHQVLAMAHGIFGYGI